MCICTCLCFSWILQQEFIDHSFCFFSGSNSHNNNNPAGDGQAGDAGEGNSGNIAVPCDKY